MKGVFFFPFMKKKTVLKGGNLRVVIVLLCFKSGHNGKVKCLRFIESKREGIGENV